jgi:uncharacterized protein
MYRNLSEFLQDWLISSDRKPLVIRGARQVGKTWVVRALAKATKKHLIEINFEKNPAQASLFESNDPKQILLNLSTLRNENIDPENCLLFLDEIQASPQIFSKLRWFAEDMPQLPVIAAGSLLEFLLAEHAFSMPVGRISYAYLEPLSFEEFLLARDKKNYYSYLLTFDFSSEMPQAIHQELMKLFKEYILVGGLPAAVLSWITEESLIKVNQIQNDLLATYRDDFAKYRGRIAIDKLDEVMMAVPRMLGQKFKYRNVNPSLQAASIKNILGLLGKARICTAVVSCAANGVPLAAEKNDKNFKEIFLDTGLSSAALGLNLNQIYAIQEITLINSGAIAEQVVGQLLRTINPPYIDPVLFYWLREDKTSNAEVDYVIQYTGKVIPIEVKAGSTGALRSLHLFMELKQLSLAIRINSELPSKTHISNPAGKAVSYELLSLPFYLIGQIGRLIM